MTRTRQGHREQKANRKVFKLDKSNLALMEQFDRVFGFLSFYEV